MTDDEDEPSEAQRERDRERESDAGSEKEKSGDEGNDEEMNERVGYHFLFVCDLLFFLHNFYYFLGRRQRERPRRTLTRNEDRRRNPKNHYGFRKRTSFREVTELFIRGNEAFRSFHLRRRNRRRRNPGRGRTCQAKIKSRKHYPVERSQHAHGDEKAEQCAFRPVVRRLHVASLRFRNFRRLQTAFAGKRDRLDRLQKQGRRSLGKYFFNLLRSYSKALVVFVWPGRFNI